MHALVCGCVCVRARVYMCRCEGAHVCDCVCGCAGVYAHAAHPVWSGCFVCVCVQLSPFTTQSAKLEISQVRDLIYQVIYFLGMW